MAHVLNRGMATNGDPGPPGPCPLCKSEQVHAYHEDRQRIYMHCLHCRLVFVPGPYWLSPEEAKAEYDLHQNDSTDKGYRGFLSRLTEPLAARLGPASKGLDFGCGPGPTLSVMLEEQGHKVDLYDPIYHRNVGVFDRRYDFICATEVVEHLQYPGKEFTCLMGMLNRGGWLGIMTKLVQGPQDFASWHYIRDLTHICFYSQSTFEFIARCLNAEFHCVDKDVVLLQKQ